MCNEAPRSTMYVVSLVCNAMPFTVAFVGPCLLKKSVSWACAGRPCVFERALCGACTLCVLHTLLAPHFTL